MRIEVNLKELSYNTMSYLKRECQNAPFFMDFSGLLHRVAFMLHESNEISRAKKVYGYPDEVLEDIFHNSYKKS